MCADRSSPEADFEQKMHSSGFGPLMYSRRQGAQRRCSGMRGTVAAGRRLLRGPDLPGWVLLVPEVVELDRILVRIHALPEPGVAEGAELTVRGQALERLPLEHAR